MGKRRVIEFRVRRELLEGVLVDVVILEVVRLEALDIDTLVFLANRSLVLAAVEDQASLQDVVRHGPYLLL